ncbi:MAG: hypothetical protein WCT22_02805 [Patescibacteria group bacterium]
MFERGIKTVGLLYSWVQGEQQLKASLERLSSKELFYIHGKINKYRISSLYRNWKQKIHIDYPVGSFVVSDVQRERRFLQIHFYPFESSKKNTDRFKIMETVCLGLSDYEDMLDIVEKLYKANGIKEIFGQTNIEMAKIAVELGFKVRNNKINSYNNIVYTFDIPQFLEISRKKLKQMKSKNLIKLEKLGISEKSARINAILSLTSRKSKRY